MQLCNNAVIRQSANEHEQKTSRCSFGAICTLVITQVCNDALMQQCTNEYEQKTNRCTFGAICTVATMKLCNNATIQKCTHATMHWWIWFKKLTNALSVQYAPLQQRNYATVHRCNHAQMNTIQKTNKCTFGALCIVATRQLYNDALMQQCTK